MPTLLVVRHAKADRPAGVDDIDRPLSARGRRDARAAGGWLGGSPHPPGLVVTSPALRARETVEGLLCAYAEPPPVVVEEQLYQASLADVLHVVRGLDDRTSPATPGRTTSPATPGRTTSPASPGRTTSPASPGRTTSPASPGRDCSAIVGHDPSFSELVTDLTDQPTQLKTCAIAVLRVPSGWAETFPSGCELVALEVPRARDTVPR